MDFYLKTYPVTDEEFNRFHSSDRRVYRRLVFNLRRDTAESSGVMALWLWLEQSMKALIGRGLIPSTIVSLIDPDLSALADESVVVLRCVEMDASLPPPPPIELPMFRRFIWNGKPINLRFFYDNRIAVVRGVAEKSNTVCLRAFRDIMQRAVEWRADEIASQMMLASAVAPPPPQPTPVLVVNNVTPVATPVMAYYYTGYGASSSNSPLNNINNIINTNTSNINNNNNNNGVITNTGSAASGYYYYNINNNTNSNTNTNTNNAMATRVDNNINHNNNQYFYNIGQIPMSVEYATNERHGDVVRAVAAPAIPAAAVVPRGGGARVAEEVDEMSEILRGLEIGLGGDDDQEIVGFNNKNTNVIAGSEKKYDDYGLGIVDFDELVPEDERTIFLTFSKGYPITETEVRDYFTSKYGDGLIEAIHMQEIRGREEQPLYARLVVRSLGSMDIFLGGHSRLKFSIAGKHVWARKYVRKTMSKFDDASPSA